MKKIFLAILLLMAILGFAGVANALAPQELQMQIQVLLQRLSNLQEQLNRTQTNNSSFNSSAWCHTFTANLRVGDKENKNGDISALATAFVKEGVFSGSVGTPRQFFTNDLAYATIKFQEKYASEILVPSGLSRGTGFVGGTTKKKLNDLYGCKINCTQDAKQCPDGSYVSRTGPNCEFAQCPEVNPPSTCTPNWSCSAWSACSNNIQTRTCSDLNSCGINTDRPGESQSCMIQSSVLITSPAGGEQWQQGKTYNINWTSTGVDKINIVIGDFYGIQIASNVSASVGTYSWTIPATFTPGSYVVTIHSTTGALNVLAASKRFNIIVPITSSITVLSPNGGEVRKVGETYDITWNSSNLPSGSYVGIGLVDYSSGGPLHYPLSRALASEGKYSWKVSTSIPEQIAGKIIYNKIKPGTKFKIQIGYSIDFRNSIRDLSDDYFEIFTPQILTCYDSDNGENIFIKGTMVIKSSNGSYKTYLDYCQDATSLQEYVCNVDPTQSQTVDNAYRLINEQCANGCENGACKKISAQSINDTELLNIQSQLAAIAQAITNLFAQ